MLCISRIWTIVDRHSGYKFLIPIPDNCKAEPCTRTYEVHLLPYVGYPNIIVFNRDSLFMSDHIQAWAASKGILVRGCVINGLADNCQYAAHIASQLIGQAIYLYCYLL